MRPPGRARFVWSYARAYPQKTIFGAVSAVSRDGVSFALPLLIREGVASLTHAPGPGYSLSILHVGLAMAGVAILRAAFQTLARLNLMSMSREIEYRMRRDLLQHLFRLDATFWARTRVGDVMALATNDLNAVRMMMGPGLSSLSESVISSSVALVVLASVDPKLTLTALWPAPVAFFILVRFGRIIRGRFEAIQAMFASMSAAVQQAVEGVRVVRAFVREPAERRRFERMNQAYVEANRGLALYSSSMDPLLTFLTGISVLMVLAYGGHNVLRSRMGVADFVMFTTYMAMLVRPISALGRVANVLERGAASAGRLQTLFLETSRLEPGAGSQGLARPVATRPPAGVKGKKLGGSAVAFEKVSVRFDAAPVLDSIDLEVAEGATVALLGATGSGKSTLVKLIPRLLDPTWGRVMINGTDCRDLSLMELRSWVGVVPQETFLFSASLAENISVGAPQTSPEEIRRFAEIAGLAPDLAALREGLDTVVGERGIMLSGGQRQRVSLARALVKNPRVLILDDALSSVDADTERCILEHLKTIMTDRTTFLITHRVSTAMHADQIVFLEGGRIVESGSHPRLLAQGGRYARLSRLQALEEALEAI